MPDTATFQSPVQYAAAILPAGSPQAAGAVAAVLPAISAPRAQLAWMVRRGCVFSLPGMAAVLSAELAGDAPDTPWRGALRLAPGHGADTGGVLEISGGARLLQGLTGIAPGTVSGLEHQPWLAAALAGRLAGTPFAGYGIAAAADTHAGTAEEQCCLRLTLRSRRHLVTALARAPIPAWLAFLSRDGWAHQHTPARRWQAVHSATAVTLARHTLPAAALHTLAAGDVIVPDTPRFSPGGRGWIQLGSRTLPVRYAAPNSLEILDMEHIMTTDDLEYAAGDGLPGRDNGTGHEAGHGASHEADHQAYHETGHEAEHEAEYETGHDAGDEAGHDAAALFSELDAALPDDGPPDGGGAPDGLDALPVTLSFELGRLALPLADVRTLGPGAVVLFDGGSPASVTIACGGQAAGRGEIVDVAGQLGIRITHWGSPC